MRCASVTSASDEGPYKTCEAGTAGKTTFEAIPMFKTASKAAERQTEVWELQGVLVLVAAPLARCEVVNVIGPPKWYRVKKLLVRGNNGPCYQHLHTLHTL